MDRAEGYRQDLREKMSERRVSLSAVQVEDYSRLIAAKLNELEPIIHARRIMGFSAIRNEVDLRFFMEAEEVQRKKILLPRVEKSGKLAAVEFESWQSTRPGAFGIMEPTGQVCSLDEIDVVLVPGLVFDAHGYRLGYGRGYYDRFLKLLPKKTFICGVCFEFQVVDDIMPHSGDVPMKWIVTDKSELVIDWDFF
ncbi:MAG: 5-formyltetrahydrofolate cyclo-ligase [Firmicutes bacterium HGW-Firmicutes-15]|nr:MAG: 5-formyltetrahydrofolate cyclo-ligase [Firmicutes bacterium HGW-Firmicutes-15]